MIDRTKRPVPGGSREVRLPAVQQARLSNGLDVWLVQRRELPLVVLNLVMQSGTDRDPLTMPGVATMTAEGLDAGTSTLNALQIAESLEQIGASFNVRAMLDGTSVSLVALSKHLAKATDIFGSVISNPVFPETEIERLRKQRLNHLIQQRDRPATIASLVFYRVLYGPQHPYGNNKSGTEASVQGMHRKNLVSFHRDHYRPNDGTIIAAGDVTLDGLVKVMEKRLGNWEARNVPPAATPPLPVGKERHIYLVDKPGAPQSEIRIGYPCLPRSTPDFFPVIVMNRILGGQFSSRLNINLRERRGLTYGAQTQFIFNKHEGPFIASAAVESSETGNAIREFLIEMEKMRADGITEEEIEFSRGGLAGSFALSFETASQQAGALQNIALYGLPMDYYSHYIENLHAVTREDISRVARRYLDTSRMTIIVVGDLQAMKGEIEELQLGEIVITDPA